MQKENVDNLQITNKEYFYNIQFFKFVFALCIVTLHVFTVYFHVEKFLGLYICVEFFFILNGFFLAKYLQSRSKTELSIKDFLINKIKKFYPIYLVSFVLVFFACPYVFGFSRIIELFMLQGFLRSGLMNIPSWYISSYLLASAWFLFFYKKIKSETVFRIFLLLLSFIILSYFIFGLKTLSTWHQNIFHVLNLGTLRGFAEISLGYLLFQYQDKIRAALNSFRINSTIVSVIEISIIFLIFKLMLTVNLQNYYLILQLFLFMALITLLNLNRGFVSNILNVRQFNYLGVISYPIYLGHFIFITYLFLHMQSATTLIKIIFVYVGTLIYAVFIDFLVKAIALKFNEIKTNIKKTEDIPA